MMNNELNRTLEENFLLAVKHHQMNKFYSAKKLYLEVLIIKDDHLAANNNIGLIFKELGDYDKATQYWQKVISIDVNFKNSHFNLGLLFHELGNYKDALNCYKKTIEIDPGYDSAHSNMALIFAQLGENDKAKSHYNKAIDISPNNISSNINLGVLYFELGDYQKALNCYEKVIDADPNNTLVINAILNLIKLPHFNKVINSKNITLNKIFLFIFNSKHVDHTEIFHETNNFLFNEKYYDHINNLLVNDSSLLNNKIVQELLKEKLFHLIIQKSLITSEFLEKLLVKLRFEILFYLNNNKKDFLWDYSDFIISLAEQSSINEYIWIQSKKEINYIDKLKNDIIFSKFLDKDIELKISILSCYVPLSKLEEISNRIYDYKSINILFNNLIKVQLKEPIQEKKLIKSIKSFQQITDPVSKILNDKYDEYPFMKWKYTNNHLPLNFIYNLNNEIQPNKVKFQISKKKDNGIVICNNSFTHPNILIAGCGTGLETISATRYKNANILGVDLSINSLAYAKRKTEELKLKNIEYLHMDIFNLKNLNKKFDVIECMGLIHLLTDPIEGIKNLLDVLEPHGFLKLGLFSDISKKYMNITKNLTKEKKLSNSIEEVRNFRKEIIEKKNDLIKDTNFYSYSHLMGLLFIDHKHSFSLKKIKEMIKELNLEFIGFNFSNLSTQKAYSKFFPNDKQNVSLDNWCEFERDHPHSFLNMYQFWVRKK